MARIVRPILWVHIAISGILGAALLIVPGRLLQMVGWAPIDPILSRVLGAALLALTWGDYVTWRRFGSPESLAFAQVHLLFSGLAALGVWRHLLVARWPAIVWVLGLGLLLSAIHWVLLLLTKRA